MNIIFSRGKFWILVLILLGAGFVYYTRQNPNWRNAIEEFARDNYILPKKDHVDPPPK